LLPTLSSKALFERGVHLHELLTVYFAELVGPGVVVRL
jgi:hypothetical protein